MTPQDKYIKFTFLKSASNFASLVPNIAYFEKLEKILRLAGGQIPLKFTKKNQCDLNAWEQPSVDCLVKIQTKCQYETP